MKEIPDLKFTEKEKNILDILIDQNGWTYQYVIVKRTGFAKSTVSYLLSKLKQKNLIDIMRDRKINVIILKSKNSFVDQREQ